jgi:hypothetical protein
MAQACGGAENLLIVSMDHIGINYVRFPADLVSEVIKL